MKIIGSLLTDDDMAYRR